MKVTQVARADPVAGAQSSGRKTKHADQGVEQSGGIVK